ncbi:hypothetical protein [Streptomyces sp. HUAS TT7]|uniref:hypothetical protein n=1 Tax=Streptomyces sp. HUAS TT7 TaxID=3447507 RepID=UPI003F65932A
MPSAVTGTPGAASPVIRWNASSATPAADTGGKTTERAITPVQREQHTVSVTGADQVCNTPDRTLHQPWE